VIAILFYQWIYPSHQFAGKSQGKGNRNVIASKEAPAQGHASAGTDPMRAFLYGNSLADFGKNKREFQTNIVASSFFCGNIGVIQRLYVKGIE